MLKLASIAVALAVMGVAIAASLTPSDTGAPKLGEVSMKVGGGRMVAQIGPNATLHLAYYR